MANTNPWTKNAWGRAETVEEPIVSFVEIMSEELVEQLTKEDTDVQDNSSIYTTDEEMARALQREFDREVEMAQLLESNTPGRNTSVAVNMDRYQPTSSQYFDDDDYVESDEEELREMNTSYMYEKVNQVLGPFIGGLMRTTEGGIISKHDPSISASRNKEQVMNGGVDVATGDCLDVEVKATGNVLNKLRSFAKTEHKRVNRLKDKEEKSTMDTSVDARTRLTLFKWINQGVFNHVDGIIATGKESAVLSARTSEDESDCLHYAIKVYKTSLIDFKNRSEYVINDFRFKNPRRVMRIWAEKEFMNLTRMHNKNLPCPEPVKLKNHIMIMGMIGDNGIAAPKMKNVTFNTDDDKRSAFTQTQEIMVRMYQECRLVHGDLSEFNLLWKEGTVYVIDVSQSMDLSHPRVLHYLLRDIDNVLSFFHRISTPDLPSRTQIFNLVSGLDMLSNDDLSCQVEAFEAENRNTLLRIDKSKPADLELRRFMTDIREDGIDPSLEYN